MATDKEVHVRQLIVDNCVAILASQSFTEWKADEVLKLGDTVMLNNSFLFREGLGTKKSDSYLAFDVGEGVKAGSEPTVLKPSKGINMQFKRLSSHEGSTYSRISLDNAIGEQLPRLGTMIFSLAGRIGAAEPAEAEVTGVSGLRIVKYQPDQTALVEVSENLISLNAIDDLSSVWDALQEVIQDADVDVDALAEKLEGILEELQEAATRPVDMSDVSEDVPSILASVVESMASQREAFALALAQHRRQPTDSDAYNELLRIAYNFANGALAFLDLMVGICDLKPLIFWLTAYEQVELARQFNQLPFSMVGKSKPSLERYRSVIANARNQAFHDLFAFDHPFRISLKGDAFQTAELRLFREHANKNDSPLTFEDQSLVDLFQGLTRTAARPVPEGFWEANQLVMQGVIDVVRALRRSLVALA